MSSGFPTSDPRCYDHIPGHIRHAIEEWVKTARPCGHFVTACLENNLAEAVNRADFDSMKAIPAIVAFLYNKCPQGCWGSPAKVAAWTGARSLE